MTKEGEYREGDRIGEEGRWERHKDDDEHKVKTNQVTKLFSKNNMFLLLTIVHFIENGEWRFGKGIASFWLIRMGFF